MVQHMSQADGGGGGLKHYGKVFLVTRQRPWQRPEHSTPTVVIE